MHKHPPLPSNFAELGLEVPLLKALAQVKYEEPSDVQRELIPSVLAGHDVLGQARTGTGKTAAFGLPILQLVDPAGRFQAIILVPTRELAVQVAGEIRRLAEFSNLHCVPVYGGQRISHQLHLLGRKPHIVVGTPGRVLDLLRRRALVFNDIRFAVLDEVDRMLDIGFRDDIRQILRQIDSKHQTIFVSATLDDEIKKLAMQFMTDPIEVNVSRDDITVDEVSQFYVTAEPWDKYHALRLLLKHESPTLAIVFCNTKFGVRKLSKKLNNAGIEAKEIHGDLVQERRERVMDKFRRHKIPVLVATDLAARGIDVQAISHIINYDMPADPQVYVHRIGRTARMGAFGSAISLVTTEQGKQLTEIEKLTNIQLTKMELEGFNPRPPPNELREPAPTPVVSRYERALFDGDGDKKTENAPPKTLGSKFPTRRRKRLR
jgi:ATP-dependent RNA helicase DeaD